MGSGVTAFADFRNAAVYSDVGCGELANRTGSCGRAPVRFVPHRTLRWDCEGGGLERAAQRVQPAVDTAALDQTLHDRREPGAEHRVQVRVPVEVEGIE